jgi:hypothetical protein
MRCFQLRGLKNQIMMIERPIFLLGMPRSGTTWLSQVFDAHSEVLVRLSPNFSYALKDRLTLNSDRKAWLEVLGEAASSDDRFLTQDWRRERGDLPVHGSKAQPRNLVIKDTRYFGVYRAGIERLTEARCLFVVRHPCATLNSWIDSAEFPENARIEEEWREGKCRKGFGSGEYWGFEDWCRQTRAFLALQEQDPEHYLVFSFEQLVRDPAANLRSLFSFTGIELSDEVLEFVTRSHERHESDGYSVFKNPHHVLERWRENFPSDIAETITAELSGTDLESYIE